MAVSILITDNFDGTVTAVSTGADALTITLKHVAVTADGPDGDTLTNAGTLAGNTTITVTASGYLNWYATWGAGGSTDEKYLPVFPGGDSVYDRCLTMIADRIKTLDLPSVDSSHVYVREIPVLEDGTMETPCVVVSDYGQQEEVREGTNGQDDYAYPVSVLFIESQSPQGDDDEARRRNLRIREAIHRAIDHIAPWDLRVPEVYQCEVRPAEVVNADWEQQYSIRASGLVVNCIARQNRGTTLGSAVTLT